MTMQTEPGKRKRAVSSLLPWLIAAAALLVYLLTFNPWVSLTNLSQVARSSGWTWGPELYSPLYYLLTYPIRWLPANQVPLALNLFSLLCGVLTLALLARSVILLPHDRTEAQRQREPSRSGLSLRSAWIPPVLAVSACGLTLTFWEQATAGSSEMLDVLALAYAIRCLLEYRVGKRESWLLRAAFVWGLATANSWVLFCLFPAFIISLIWIRGMSFFDVRFLLRMFVCGAAGTLLYLFLPLVHVLSSDSLFSFWQALKQNLLLDRTMLMLFAKQVPRNVLLLLAMTSLLPVLVISIRWASNFGDPSRMGSFIANWIFHLAHGALLVVCVWVMFDPDFSPRHKNFPFLALYYLGALSVGYLSGYFLLVFKPIPDHMGRTARLQEWLHRGSTAGVWILLVVVPAGLIAKNLGQIRMTNGPALREYAARLVQKLPDKAVLLGDPDDQKMSARKLFLAEAWLTRLGKETNYYFLETYLLKAPAYHAFQQKLHPGEWPVVVSQQSAEVVDDLTRIQLLGALAEKNPLCYMHPSFGAFFEFFYQQPHGLSFALKLCTTNSLAGPPLTEAEIADNEAFWSANEESVRRLIPFITPPPPESKPGLKEKLLRRLHISFEPNATAATLGAYYSLALNFWGVQLQRAGKFPEAGRRFETALALNARNIAAKANLAVNRDLRDGRRPEFHIPRVIQDELGTYRGLQPVLRDGGPFDDPSQCFGQALVFKLGKNVRQSAQQLERVYELVPDSLPVRISLAQLYIENRLPDKALDLLNGLDSQASELAGAGVSLLDLFQARATALFVAGRTAELDQLLQDAMRRSPRDQELLSRVVQMSATFGRLTNALAAIDLQLQLKPDDPATLVNKGVFSLHLRQFQDAIPPLTQAIALQTNNHNAQLFRAVAYLNCERLDEAQKDYECLQKIFPKAIEVNGGLGEVAARKGDTNAAIRYFELALADSTPGSDQARYFSERLKSLKPSP